MKLEIGQHGLTIKVETDQDVAYVRDTLGLKSKDDKVFLKTKETDFKRPYELYTEKIKQD